MSENLSGNRTIAKNTAFLYVRMLIVLFVSLYTSRVVLRVLGADDFGLYQTVGGIVWMLAFINNALSTGTSRFITFALGKGDDSLLRNTFSMSMVVHILLALLVLIGAETIGLWYLDNKMVIPPDRYHAAGVVYQLSIFSAFLTIIQVPLGATITAHEHISVFAYSGIADAILRLGIVFLLQIGNMDKLILYAFLLFFVQALLFLFYLIYCKRCFKEVNLSLSFEKTIFKEIMSFSGWSLFSNGAIALSAQGYNLLLNLFFPNSVIAARTVAAQVSGAAGRFVDNFRTAVNPQIVKRSAAGNEDNSRRLVLDSTKISYFMMLLIAVPVFFLAEPILHVWLGEVPDYSGVFLKIAIVQSLFQVFDISFYMALYAKGQIWQNALLSPLVTYLAFPVVYFLFKAGAPPTSIAWASLVCCSVIGLIIKPVLIHKIANYPWGEIVLVFRTCFLVSFAAFPLPLLLYFCFDVSTLFGFALILLSSVICVTAAVWFLGLDSEMRSAVIAIVKRYLQK